MGANLQRIGKTGIDISKIWAETFEQLLQRHILIAVFVLIYVSRNTRHAYRICTAIESLLGGSIIIYYLVAILEAVRIIESS